MKSGHKEGWIFISNVTSAAEFTWLAEWSARDRLPLRFILFNASGSDLHQSLQRHGFPVHNYDLRGKWQMLCYILLFALKLALKKPRFVHCHLLEASLTGITAAWLAGVRKRIMTRHHGDLHHLYHPHAVKYDRLLNRLCTHIIAVSEVLARFLTEKEFVPVNKITVIPHGLPSGVLKRADEAAIKAIKQRYNLQDRDPVIGMASRFVEWKGIQYALEAFTQLLHEYPSAQLVLTNARGNYEKQIKTLLRRLPDNSYRLVEFEKEMTSLFSTFDVFVHVPVSLTAETFGQVYLEALALGIPMVCTLSGIAPEIVKHEQNALVVNYRDSAAVHRAMKKLLSDGNLRAKLSEAAPHAAVPYTFDRKYAQLKSLYFGE